MDLNYHSMESLLEAAKENNCRLSALVLEQQAEQMELPSRKYMKKMREKLSGLWHPVIQPGSAPDLKAQAASLVEMPISMRTVVEQGKNSYRPPSWRSPLSCTLQYQN